MPHTDPVAKAAYQLDYRKRNAARKAELGRAYREANADAIKARKHADYIANRDAVKARVNAYRAEHVDEINAKRRTSEHREAVNEYRRSTYIPHPLPPPKTHEEVLADKRVHYAHNRTQIRAKQADYYQRNKDKWAGAWQKKPYWAQKFEHGLKKAVIKGGEIIDLPSIRAFYKQVYTQTAGICEYCRGVFPVREIIVEHKQPYSLGGCHAVTNFAVSCNPCNLHKAETPYDKWVSFAAVKGGP